MQKCPNCGKKTIKNVTKACTGPARIIKCKECGARLSVPWKSLYLILIYLIAMIVACIFLSGTTFYLSLVIGYILFVWMQIQYIPLIKG